MKIIECIKLLFCAVCAIIFLSNNCQAIEDIQSDTAHNNSPPIKKEKKIKKIKVESNNTIPELNKNLLDPNVSPGAFPGIDIERTKQYYQNMENRNGPNTPESSDNKEEDLGSIKLPERTVNDIPSVHIKQVSITKSKIFSDDELNHFKSLAEEKELTSEDINNLVDLINLQYKKKNIITAQAFLPVQNLKGGVLNIELIEAKIGAIHIEDNKYNRKWFLKSQYSQKAGDILNLKTLESDLQRFNQNSRSVKLSAKLKPGEEYGTTNVTLLADEQCPAHLSVSYDSFGRETTGLLRSGIMASTDTFIGFQDRLSAAVNMSRSSVSPYFDYNIPINSKGTRIGASYIYGRNDISQGQYKDFDITSRTNVFSTYITHPLIQTSSCSLNFNTSTNMKVSTSSISDYMYSKYNDYNIAVGLGGQYKFEKSVLYGSLYSTNGIISDKMNSQRESFTKLNGDVYYIHYLPKEIISTIRIGGQYSPDNVAYIEQYQVGGMSSVRGYTESLLMAASAYYGSFELLFPIPFFPREVNVPFSKKESKFALKDSVKFALFADTGAILPYKEATTNLNFIASVGAGLRFVISKYLTARMYVGIPLMNKEIYGESSARLHFDLIASPF